MGDTTGLSNAEAKELCKPPDAETKVSFCFAVEFCLWQRIWTVIKIKQYNIIIIYCIYQQSSEGTVTAPWDTELVKYTQPAAMTASE